jgi:stage V sporulation protein B
MGEGQQKSFIKGAAILTTAGLIAKVMGFVYRVILTRLIDAEGMGLYQMAYPVYTTLLVISRSGIPVSLAKLISERIALDERRAAFKIFKVGRQMGFIVGLFFSIVMVLLAKPLIALLKWDPRVYYAILALSPAIFFVSLMATYRGFFQGLQNMKPTAISQVIEQLVRMVTMIGLVYFLVPYGKAISAAGATFGAVTGSMTGLLVLLYIYYKRRKNIWKYVNEGSISNIDTWKIVKEITTLGIPITIGALVQPLMTLVDTIVVPQRLQVAGYAIEKTTALFGELAAVAMTLVNFPTIITVSLAASLVPSISEAFALKKDNLIKYRTRTGLRLALLISLPSAMGLYILAKPLTTVIFAVPTAASSLRIVAWGVLFIALQQTSSAILQGIGETGIPARNLLLGALVNGIINYTLTAQPQFGIRGAAFGTTTGFAVAAFLNLIYVKKFTQARFKFKEFVLKPVGAALLMGIVVYQGFNILSVFLSRLTDYGYSLALFLIVIIAILVYGIILLLLREVKYSDLAMIPRIGKKMADTLKKIGLVRE